MDKKSFIILLASTIIAAFLGAFIASAVFSDKPKPYRPLYRPMTKQRQVHLKPNEVENVFEQQEEMLERDMRFFDRFDSDMDDLIKRSSNSTGFIQMNTAGLKTEETPSEYKIVVDLKPFGNNEKNVSVRTRGNVLKISAGYESNEKNNFNSSQFYQALTLPTKIEPRTIKKEIKGNRLTIIIPKK